MRYFMILFCLVWLSLSLGIAQDVQKYLEAGKKAAYEGKYKKAIKYYNKVLKINPKLAEAYYDRGNIKYNLKQYQEAIDDCSRALGLDSSLINAYFNLAISKYHLEDYTGALLDFNQALRVNPDDAESLCWRGVTKHKLGKNEEACKDWNKAKDLGNSYVNDYLNRYCGEENQVDTGPKP